MDRHRVDMSAVPKRIMECNRAAGACQTPVPSNRGSGAAAGKGPLTHFTSAFLERTREIMLQFGKDAMELHDIVAVWCAIANPPQPEGQMPELSPGWAATGRAFDIER